MDCRPSMTDSLSGPWKLDGVLLDLDFEADTLTEEEGGSGLCRRVEIDRRDKILLLRQIFEDVKFLAAHRVMDYSLFICRSK